MIEIYFQDTLDAIKMYTSLKNKLKSGLKKLSLSYDDANLITITNENQSEGLLKSFLVPALSEFILKVKEDQWMLAIISDFFYFDDDEEQQQILSIAHSISDGDISDIPEIHTILARSHLIEQTLNEFIKVPISFSFESFVKFRLKDYQDILFQFVEISIDEYKLEQEYQSFIQTLRELLHKREPRLTCLHIVHKDHLFYFYNEHFHELQSEDMKKLIDRKLFMNQPIYIDSSILAPLVSIAPNVINLYTNDVDYNMIQTILSVFQERVNLYSLGKFYFLKKQP